MRCATRRPERRKSSRARSASRTRRSTPPTGRCSRGSDLDAVYVMLPPYAHGPEMDVIEAGCHLFVEKPLHLDIRKAERIRDAAHRKGLITCAGYMTRYRKGVQRVRALLSRACGMRQPTLLYGGWFGSPYLVPWWINKRMSGGQHVEQTTHSFDLARYLFGEVTSLHACSSKGAMKVKGYSIEDASCVSLNFANGAIGNIMSCCIAPKGAGAILLSVYTTKFVAHFSTWKMDVEIHTEKKGRSRAGGVERIAGEEDIFEAEDAAFAKALRTGRQDAVLSSYADGVESLRLSLCASESMRTGRPVRVRG
ncbi:MAG: Gfo/Idh/MocA family oxidoreductase [Planctomycetota bacterium]